MKWAGVSEKVYIFVLANGKVGIDYQYGEKRGSRLYAVCNSCCGAYRNVYIKGVVVSMGIIHKGGEK